LPPFIRGRGPVTLRPYEQPPDTTRCFAIHLSSTADVTYDPQWGYPVTIQTGGRADAIDDEISVAVTSFQEGR
jgi:hypothetical protein